MKRKLRKLRKHPSAFLLDMVKNRVQQTRRLFGAKRSQRRYSVIAAVYGAESYLDDFFRSLVRQSIGFEQHIELIMVDDGSPDRSAEVIARWQQKYPHVIRYVRKENGGQASARNVGLEHATGDWVTFIDPDDFVDVTYFERIDELLDRPDAADVALVSCNFIVYDEKTRQEKDIHPLRFRFTKGDRVVHSLTESGDIQLTVNSALFRSEVLRRTGLQFDERIRPSFEDAHFSNRYLLETEGAPVAFLASAKYYYRKRADQSSTLDGAWQHPGLYREVLEHGCLDLLRRAGARSDTGARPEWLQRAVLYHLIWYFKRLVDNEASVAFLSDEQRRDLAVLLRELIRRIDSETIIRFELGGVWLFHKIGLLGLKGEQPPFQHVYVQHFDRAKNLVQLRYFHHGEEELEVFTAGAEEAFPAFSKSRAHDLLGDTFVFERIVWVPLGQATGRLHAQIGEGVTRVVHRRKIHRDGVPISEIVSGERAAAPRGAAGIEQRLATSRPIASYYADAFLFMDRDTQADDNAEHLYRYVRRVRPDINAFFVLRPSSHDWSRLRREGFRLLAYGSPSHRLALLNAKHIISSHADHYVVSHPGGNELTALLRARFTFLQHGVTKDDISGWLNGKEIDCFVTASAAEHASIVSDGPYKYTDREVVLSGFPRHDALADVAHPSPQRLLVIMPTWRQSLVGAKKDGGNDREINPAFYESEYARTWKSLLHSPELRALAHQHGYRVQFFPHANIHPYLDWFAAPAWIETLSHRIGSMQEIFRAASIMLTDYSSTAFEMAYLRKAVLYYQFDRDEVFSGAHIYRKGYFDYERDGFGPVCTDEAALLAELRTLLAADGAPAGEHLARMESTFAFRDGRCCERTLDAILALDAPDHPRAHSAELLVAAARSATAHRAWPLAERRWERVLELDEAQRPRDVEIRLAEAKRELGKLDEAGELLDVAAARDGECEAVLCARAELATSAEHWARAAELWTALARRSSGGAAVVERLRAADAYRNLGDFVAAAESLDALPAEVASVEAEVARAELASAARCWDEAADAWSALASSPDAPPHSLLRLAEALLHTSRLEPALQALDAHLASPGPLDERRARALRLMIREQLRRTERLAQSPLPETSSVRQVDPHDSPDESASQS